MNGNVAFDGGSLGGALQFKRLCPSFKLEIPNSMENTTVEEIIIKNLAILCTAIAIYDDIIICIAGSYIHRYT